ncbi:glycosyl hydrolase family protein [Cohnella endophytica]|uniref:Glycosyl hydrolase family protein n=1 Tax=Cohnella endophytica TaxID=2419778 RepID=A0A494Y9L1_9BACL|nr:family 16 glycosylhydrolase [Cohnella endophytica]RKP57373.1 glycosyl hydrolase family protein [Cohnella endophytica]
MKLFNQVIVAFLMIALFTSTASLSPIYAAAGNAGAGTGDTDPSPWTLVWNDEFNAQTLDQSKWNYTTGGGGFGNHELQNYTNRPENVRVENGNLVLEARKENYQGNQYTSGKLETKAKGDWKYGKFEFRAKLPEGKGLWPAIWMMPSDSNVYGGWPVGGEIDIMEYLGHDPGTVYGTIHYGNPWTHTGESYTLPDNRKFSDDFHVFSLEWSPGEMKWYVDGVLFSTKNDWFSKDSNKPADYPYPAPFDQYFYLQLNLAVGGDWPGNPDATTDWTKPKQMLVDYVRVYQYNGQYPEPGTRPGKSLSDGWSWVREISSNWYAESNPDAMRLTTAEGSWGAANKPSSILLRNPGTSDFTVSTKVKFDAKNGFEWAGLVVYQDDGNAITLGRQANGTPGVNQLRFSQIKGGAQKDKNYADLVYPSDIYLKIEKTGTIYKGYYSSDGVVWTQVADTFDLALSSPKVGIFARKFNTAIPVKTAEFTNFMLNGSYIPFASPKKAAAINVTGANGVSAITSKGGKLQLSAEVLPDDAADKNVTWSVTNADGTATDLATIDAEGLLTAAKDGTVKVIATANDGSGVKGEASIAISGQSVNATVATLIGPDAVYRQQPFDLTVGVSSLLSSFTTLNVVVNYDPNVLEFNTITGSNGSLSLADDALSSLRNHFNVLGTAIKADKGQILILMASEGNDYAISTVGDLLTVHAKAKSGAAADETTVSLSDIKVSFEGSGTPVDGVSLRLQIKEADKAELNAAIIAAQKKHDEATEGNNIGQYPIGSKAILQTAINDAKAVRDNAAATQAEVANALSALNTAVTTFINSVHTDPGVVDKTSLRSAIAAAQAKYDASIEGNKIGQYPAAAKAELPAAITSANAVLGSSAATQTQVNAATATVNTALQTFMTKIVTLVPGETSVTINDLSVIAKYYGTKKTDANWSKIEAADLFDSGKIDIQVLAAVARMILDNWLLEN